MEHESSGMYLRESTEAERRNQLGKALYCLLQAHTDPTYAPLAELIRSNIDRLLNKASRLSLALAQDVVPIYEHANNPRTFVRSGAHSRGRPLVALTTISSRLHRVEQTIKSLLGQDYKPHSINLYVSDAPYLIDKGVPTDEICVKRIYELGANIYNVVNLGPYRKQYPIIWQLRHSGAHKDTPFITFDDDVLYPQDIVGRLIQRLKKEDAVISHRGRSIAYQNKKIQMYKNFGVPSEQTSYMNIATGRNGIAYRVSFFSEDCRDFVGPILAPTADDIWCKWATAACGIPTTILEPNAATSSELDFEASLEEQHGLYQVYNAKGTNDEAIQTLETYFEMDGRGIWSWGP